MIDRNLQFADQQLIASAALGVSAPNPSTDAHEADAVTRLFSGDGVDVEIEITALVVGATPSVRARVQADLLPALPGPPTTLAAPVTLADSGVIDIVAADLPKKILLKVADQQVAYRSYNVMFDVADTNAAAVHSVRANAHIRAGGRGQTHLVR